MTTFNAGDRVQYTGRVWEEGFTGTVLYPKSSGGTTGYRVKLDKPMNGFKELTVIAGNLIPENEPPATVRAKVLDEAKRITATDRNSAYGEPEDNFQRIADYWNVWLQDRLKEGAKITPGDTAAMMIFVKMAREMNAPKEDNKVDGAGYFACWAEVDVDKL